MIKNLRYTVIKRPETTFVTGPRGVGKETLMKILAKLGGEETPYVETSKIIEWYRTSHDTSAARELMQASSVQANGKTIDDGPVIVAVTAGLDNIIKSRRPKHIYIGGYPRSWPQIEEMRNRNFLDKVVHLTSSFQESVTGAYQRVLLGVRRDDAAYQSLLTAWDDYQTKVKPAVEKYAAQKPESVLTIPRSMSLEEKIFKSLAFIDIPLAIQGKLSRRFKRNSGHPARAQFERVMDEIARTEELAAQAAEKGAELSHSQFSDQQSTVASVSVSA